MIEFIYITGYIISINDFYTGNEKENGCYKIITLEDLNKNVNKFVVNPKTFILDRVTLKLGDLVTAYYDGLAPVLLIYPPQYTALVLIKVDRNYSVKVDYFDKNLISRDGKLKIMSTPITKITLENGLYFTNKLENRNLIVKYKVTTKSIPALTYPNEIIVLCNKCE